MFNNLICEEKCYLYHFNKTNKLKVLGRKENRKTKNRPIP